MEGGNVLFLPVQVQRTCPLNGPVDRKKDPTERAMGVGRRTREETIKWNKMTALRFQMGGDI